MKISQRQLTTSTPRIRFLAYFTGISLFEYIKLVSFFLLLCFVCIVFCFVFFTQSELKLVIALNGSFGVVT